MRPLKAISNVLVNWARRDQVCCTVKYSGRIRTAIDLIGIALGWMSKGYLYDDRTFFQRMKSGNYYWMMAIAVLTFRDLAKAHARYCVRV